MNDKEKDILWAPWRIGYVTAPEAEGCIFCNKAASSEDEKNFILYRGEYAFALLNIYPYNNGHLMIAPYTHTGNLTDIEPGILHEMQDTVQRFVSKITDEMQPQGFNIGMNLGRTAGAGIEDHLHIHVVPRWNGDTNFMPVIGDQKVLSESLESAYSRLKL